MFPAPPCMIILGLVGCDDMIEPRAFNFLPRNEYAFYYKLDLLLCLLEGDL